MNRNRIVTPQYSIPMNQADSTTAQELYISCDNTSKLSGLSTYQALAALGLTTSRRSVYYGAINIWNLHQSAIADSFSLIKLISIPADKLLISLAHRQDKGTIIIGGREYVVIWKQDCSPYKLRDAAKLPVPETALVSLRVPKQGYNLPAYAIITIKH